MKKFLLLAFSVYLLSLFYTNNPALTHIMPGKNTGLINGIEKFWIEPTELLLSLGLSSLAIQGKKDRTRSLLLLLPSSWIIGALAGFNATPIIILNVVTIPGLEIIGKNPSLIVAFGLITTGGLVALSQEMNKPWFRFFVFTQGLCSGLTSGLLLNSHPGGFYTLSGEWATMGLFTFLITYILRKASFHWARIGIRVIGSWIAAAGILLLGFYIKYPQ